MIGGNKSAEDEGCDDAEDASRHGIDVVMASNLREFPCSKDECRKGLRKYAKKIFAKLEESNPEAGKIFKEKAADVIKSLLSKFDDLQVFTVEDPNMDPCDADAMFIFVEFVGDKPFLYYFKDGLLEEKMVGIVSHLFEQCVHQWCMDGNISSSSEA